MTYGARPAMAAPKPFTLMLLYPDFTRSAEPARQRKWDAEIDTPAQTTPGFSSKPIFTKARRSAQPLTF